MSLQWTFELTRDVIDEFLHNALRGGIGTERDADRAEIGTDALQLHPVNLGLGFFEPEEVYPRLGPGDEGRSAQIDRFRSAVHLERDLRFGKGEIVAGQQPALLKRLEPAEAMIPLPGTRLSDSHGRSQQFLGRGNQRVDDPTCRLSGQWQHVRERLSPAPDRWPAIRTGMGI